MTEAPTTDTTTDENAPDPVRAARSRLANTCRNHSGDPEAIADARDALEVAKANRLREDSGKLLEGMARDRTVIIGYDRDLNVDRKTHDNLVTGQHEATQEFLSANGPARHWSAVQTDAWQALLAAQRLAHKELGCAATATCRSTGRG